MKEEKSIFQLILDNSPDDVLREDFYIPEEDGSGGMFSFAPGARDGISIYHTAAGKLDGDGRRKMEEAVESAAAGKEADAEKLFLELTRRHRAISVIDELQNYVRSRKDSLNLPGLSRTAAMMAIESRHIECVKIALELLELFNNREEIIKDVIRVLGMYDEFTIFAVWNMQNWENGNEEIFELAREVHGWGRIHAVERLEPETEEIRHWLLTEGARNTVLHAYSALTCWRKANAEEILYGNPTREEYAGLSVLIGGLLDEGPVAGISALEDPKGVLERFLVLSRAYDLTREQKDVIEEIGRRAEAGENTPGE